MVKKAARCSTFHIWKSRRNKQWYVSLTAPNGEKVLASEGYKRRGSAIAALAAMAYASLFNHSFKLHISRNKKYYFTLVGKNHEVIGMSQMYKTPRSRDRGIKAVKKACKNAQINIRK